MMNLTINHVPALVNPLSYPAYKALSEEHVLLQKTSGPEQSEEKIAYTKLNQQRMKRVEKQFSIMPGLQTLLQQINGSWNWLVLAETWCGDGAQVLPAIAAIAEASPAVTLTLLLRDENPNLMDTALTNGSRSIPILICQDAATGKRLFTWGPRPTEIQKKVLDFKTANPAATKEELHHELHLWYARDKSLALQQDLYNLIKNAIEIPVPALQPA